MAPQSWATKEEQEFLRSLLPEYEACQVKRRYKAFWQRLNREYFAKFSAIERCFPGLDIGQLDEGQKAQVSEVILKQQKRLKEWYRWQMNPRSRNAGYNISKKDLRNIYTGRTRVAKPYEVFAKLYAREVEEVRDRRCAAEGVTGRQQLTIWHEVARELFSTATEEQLAAVEKEIQGVQEDGLATPQTYLRYLKKLPTLLDATISPAVRKAGVLAVVTVVGPDPEKDGKIMSRTFQFGDKSNTPLFSNVWAEHDTVFVEELARFARKYEFPPETCSSRSLGDELPMPVSEDAKQDGTETDTTDDFTVEVNSETERPPLKRSSRDDVRPAPASSTGTSTAMRPQKPGYRMIVLDSDEDDDENEEGEDQHHQEEEDAEEDAEDDEDEDLDLEADPNDSMKLPGEWQFSEGALDAFLAAMNTLPTKLFITEELLRFEDTLETSKVTLSSQPQPRPNLFVPRESAHPQDPNPISSSQTNSFSGKALPPQAPRTRAFNWSWGPVSGSQPPRKASPAPGTPAASTRSTLPESFARFKGLLSTPLMLDRSYNAPNPPFTIPRPLPPLSPSAETPPFSTLSTSRSSFGKTRPNFSDGAQEGRSSAKHIDGQLISRIQSPSSTAIPPPSSLFNPHRLPKDPQLDVPHGGARSPPPATPTPHPHVRPHSQPSQQPPPLNESHSDDEEPLASLVRKPERFETRSPSNAGGATSSEYSQSKLAEPRDSRPPSVPPPPPSLLPPLSLPHPPAVTPPPAVPSPPAVPPPPVIPPPPAVPPSTSRREAMTGVKTHPSGRPKLIDDEVDPGSPEDDTTPIPTEPTRRRSARGSVPSKRQEQLQKIGTNELQNPTAKLGEEVDCAWFLASLENLATYDFGDLWRSVIKKWESLERTMGQGKIGKGSLPTRGRPDEWAKWTAKTWRGIRAYDKVPPIDDPADIGIAIVKWWSLMQPPFRASNQDLPLPVYSSPDADGDPWGTLRKSGPNGFIALIMLMAWWGNAASTQRSEWQDDSLPLWRSLLKDIDCVLYEMVGTSNQCPSASVGKRAHDTEHSQTAGSSKRKCR